MKLSTFDRLFKSDEERSVNGAPIPFGFNQNGDPITLWIAETGNPNHEKCQRRYSRQLEQSRKNRLLYNETIARIVAESVLVKWEGFIDENGKEIPCTSENKFQMLKKYDRFMTIVLAQASDHSNFSIDSDVDPEEDTEGNSETSSPGT